MQKGDFFLLESRRLRLRNRIEVMGVADKCEQNLIMHMKNVTIKPIILYTNK